LRKANIFGFEVEADARKLDPKSMPSKLAGVFATLLSKHVGIERAGCLPRCSSHTIWFHSNRHGFNFMMSSPTSLDFHG